MPEYESQRSLVDRIRDYLPAEEVLKSYQFPGPIELEKDRFAREVQRLSGADFVLTRIPDTFRGGSSQFAIVPINHPLNGAVVPQQPGSHYGQLAFEGGSLVPVLGDNGELVGANLVLFPERMARLERSVTSLSLHRGAETTYLLKEFAQGTQDLAAVLGASVLKDKEGLPKRAYVRPAVARAGAFGVTPLPEDSLVMDTIIWNWPTYLPQNAYDNGAVAAAFLDTVRTAVRGKVAGNYSHAGEIGQRARQLSTPEDKIHEAIIWAPFWVDPNTKTVLPLDPLDRKVAMGQILRGGVPADGPGEDLIFIDDKKRELYYQPKATGILAGTTRQYIIDHLAPAVGLEPVQRLVTINDLRAGGLAMCFVGNAVKVCPTREIRIVDDQGQEAGKRVELDISPEAREMSAQFELELSGRVETSGPLLTPVNFADGVKARAVLDKAYQSWL